MLGDEASVQKKAAGDGMSARERPTDFADVKPDGPFGMPVGHGCDPGPPGPEGPRGDPIGRITPVRNRVVILPDPVTKQSRGGILIPDNAQERPMRGTVVAVGPGDLNLAGAYMPMQCKIGDRVLFPRFTGEKFDANGTEYVVMEETKLLAVLS